MSFEFDPLIVKQAQKIDAEKRMTSYFSRKRLEELIDEKEKKNMKNLNSRRTPTSRRFPARSEGDYRAYVAVVLASHDVLQRDRLCCG